ncbi:MAG: hypothetical protein AAGB22_02715, partial [Bacteroidota bacterium]
NAEASNNCGNSLIIRAVSMIAKKTVQVFGIWPLYVIRLQDMSGLGAVHQRIVFPRFLEGVQTHHG